MATKLSDVATLAGVSIKTVSNVIHDYPHIRPETKQRVLDAITQLNYRPNLNARNLRSGRTGVIGLVVPTLRNPYFSELAEAVIDAADRNGVSVLIEQSRHTQRATKAQLVDGLLYSVLGPGQEDTGLFAQTTSASAGEGDEATPLDHVTMRNTEAIRPPLIICSRSGARASPSSARAPTRTQEPRACASSAISSPSLTPASRSMQPWCAEQTTGPDSMAQRQHKP